MLYAAIALIVARAMRRAIVIVINDRGAVVVQGAEADGYRGEGAQRHKRN